MPASGRASAPSPHPAPTFPILDLDQTVRNIDCLLDRAGPRAPSFWMFVKDRNPQRAYCQLTAQYLKDPTVLHEALPHRPERLLDRVLKGLALVAWSDLLALLHSHGFTGQKAAVLQEITRRVS